MVIICKEVKNYPAHCRSLTSFYSFLPPVVYPPLHCRVVKSVGSGSRLVSQLHHLFTRDLGQAVSFLLPQLLHLQSGSEPGLVVLLLPLLAN